MQVWQDIPEFLSNKLQLTQKRALHNYYLSMSTLAVWKKDKLSSAVNIFGRCLKIIILLASSYQNQQLVDMVTTCGPVTTTEIIIVYADRSCCRTHHSDPSISFTSKYVDIYVDI